MGGGKGSSGITRECETHPGGVPVASGGYESGSGSWKTEIDRDSTPKRYTWSMSSESILREMKSKRGEDERRWREEEERGREREEVGG